MSKVVCGRLIQMKQFQTMISMIRKIILIVSILCLVAGSAAAGKQENELRMALLPVPDVLPAYVAEAQGYFAREGVEVKLLPVGSAVERDQLMQAGLADGIMNEISGAASFNRNENTVKIVSIARAPIGDSPLFRILAAPGSGITKAGDLADVPIGISVNTVIEYISDRMLVAAGLDRQKISFMSVPVLPERLQLLLSGQIKAATLPDPLGAAAVKGGAVEIMNDTAYKSVSASVLTFTNNALENKKEAVLAFMRAWDMACGDLNEKPDQFRPIMMKKIRVPPNVREDFVIPPMPRNQLPTRAQWDDVMAWMVEKKLLEAPLAYEESVTGAYLP